MKNFEKPLNIVGSSEPQIHGEGSSLLSDDEKERLKSLRKKQIDSELTPEERDDFLILQKKEEEKGGTINDEEKKELSELRKTQIEREFTPDELERFLCLQSKEEGVEHGVTKRYEDQDERPPSFN